MGEVLRDAAARGDSVEVVRLLGEGVKCVLDQGGRNALHLAAAGGHSDVVAALLLARWDANAQDAAGYTALQRAAADGHVAVIKQLVKHGANINIQDKVHGNTALHEASWKGFSKCVEALCEVPKANLQIKNVGGFAPLHLACQNGHNQSCRELLMANANPDIQNNYGDTPLHTSARYGHAGVTRILISADCRVSDQNKNGDTALHITAAMGRRKLTRILLEAGCDAQRRNKQNERAKDIAVRKDLIEIIQIIDKTVPIKRKDQKKEKEKKEKEKKKGNDKKREKNESGSSKDSSSRQKEKKKHKNDHQVHFEQLDKIHEAKWSAYGCHYYPDPKTFPKPKLDSLPHEPLKKGEQYYLDLAGNIRKGPVGVGYTCYCAPFFRHMEERLDRDKKELKDHIDAAHVRLDKKVTSLEAKTRGQLNEITRNMAVERAKCQQRHLHLEQWLIRGTIFRNSERVKTSQAVLPPLPKARSLENILEELTPLGDGQNHRSVDVLNAKENDFDDYLKDRSSSREGKESGKGSSEVVGLGTSDGEEQKRSSDEEKPKLSGGKRSGTDRRERRLRRTTREISERIDEVLKNGDGPESMEMLYDEMMKWRNYHSTHGKTEEYKDEKENQRLKEEEPFRRMTRQSQSQNVQQRRSYHDLLKESNKETGEERRARRLSDPQAVEEPERRSVQEIVAKLQKQQTVQELVAKIQRKTGLIHKSAQKWKENKARSKEKDSSTKFPDRMDIQYKTPTNEHQEKDESSESSEGEDDEVQNGMKVPPNYENIRQWDGQQELSQLPYRCRNTVYSPSQELETDLRSSEYQRNLYRPTSNHDIERRFVSELRRPMYDSHDGLDSMQYGRRRSPKFDRRIFASERNLRSSHSPTAEVGNEFYDRALRAHPMERDEVEAGMRAAYSPTQNDSGYSTKPYGGSSTGPSPSLSGPEYEGGSGEMKPPVPVRNRSLNTALATASLV